MMGQNTMQVMKVKSDGLIGIHFKTNSVIDIGEPERLGVLDPKIPWKSVFALMTDTNMQIHNSLLSVPLTGLFVDAEEVFW